MTASQPRTHWNFEDLKAGLRIVVVTGTGEEAQAVA